MGAISQKPRSRLSTRDAAHRLTDSRARMGDVGVANTCRPARFLGLAVQNAVSYRERTCPFCNEAFATVVHGRRHRSQWEGVDEKQMFEDGPQSPHRI